MMCELKGQMARRENGFVTEAACFKKENHRYGGGQFKAGRMVITAVVSLIGERSCYRGCHFNGGRMVTLQRWPV